MESHRPKVAGGCASPGDFASQLSAGEDERINQLICRADSLHRQLDRLAHLGIYPLTRADSDYPQYYRQRLKDSAPAGFILRWRKSTARTTRHRCGGLAPPR
jgi:predicted Rossmann fold nucleotide-binding protein DprA/Smf involved in DNA uptake